jgi:hypothetical protein
MTDKEEMNSNRKTAELEDVKINVKIKLSALWVAAMFLYVYGDILGIMKPGAIEDFIIGIGATGDPVTQVSLLGIALFMAIPSVMVFLSLTLKPKANRWANIILGLVYTCAIPLSMFIATSVSAYYIFLGIVEVVLTALVVWYAWKWPKQEA